MSERKIVVPGETIVSGENFLPGDGVRREGDDIVANRFGLADVSDRLVKANDNEKNDYQISPSGYGIHWRLIDEDLSINELLNQNKSLKTVKS